MLLKSSTYYTRKYRYPVWSMILRIELLTLWLFRIIVQTFLGRSEKYIKKLPNKGTCRKTEWHFDHQLFMKWMRFWCSLKVICFGNIQVKKFVSNKHLLKMLHSSGTKLVMLKRIITFLYAMKWVFNVPKCYAYHCKDNFISFPQVCITIFYVI